MLDTTSEKDPRPTDVIRTATLDKIRHFLESPEDVDVYGDLRGLCSTVSVSYRNRAVLELLQNAHDAHDPSDRNGRIRFVYDAGEGDFGVLYAANDGRGFTRANFKALCSPTRTTKAVNEAIGNKGVGFLSVFQICAHPEVYSKPTSRKSGVFDGYCFTFADNATLQAFLAPCGLADRARRVAATMPQLYLATPSIQPPPAVESLGEDGYATVLRLPLKNAEARLAVETQLTELAEGQPDVQLFLERISELRIEFGGTTHVLGRAPETLHEGSDLVLQNVTCGERRYIVARRTLPETAVREVINADVLSEALPERWNDWIGDAVISIAVTADGPPIDGRLYTFLPMGKGAPSPFAGHMDAPFFATIERKDLEEGGTFNPWLLDECRRLAFDAARIAKTALPDEAARRVVADLLFWTGEGATEVRKAVAESQEALVPAQRVNSTPAWARLDDVRIWDGDDFFTARRVAGSAAFPILDVQLGAARITRFRKFMFPGIALAPNLDDKAKIAAAVAQDLHRASAPISEWNGYYAALPALLPNAGGRLQGKPLLLTDRGDLALAEAPPGEAKRGKKRLSSTFMPPIRTGPTAMTLPTAVQRRITYLNSGLACAQDGANAARRYLTGSGLAREYDRREILRVMAGLIDEPGQAKDPEQSRWDTLHAIMAICAGEGGFADVGEIGLMVPTREGWVRASDAFFGDWPGTRSADLDALFEKAGPVSPELQALGQKRLLPYRDWNVPAGQRDAWILLLRRAGVSDHLRPIPVLQRPAVRANGNMLIWTLSQRPVEMSSSQKASWIQRLKERPSLANPQTIYTARDVWRLPGQADYAEIAAVAAEAYAIQVVRMLEAQPDLDRMIVLKPDHANAPDQRTWPSPAAAFLTVERWIPTAGDARAALTRAWLPAAQETPPPQAPLVSPALRTEIDRADRARETLGRLGLSVLGAQASAWHLLAQAPGWLEHGRQPGERLLALTQDAWAKANLGVALPAGIQLLARVDGEVIAFDPRTEARPVYIADAEDRAMVGALSRAAKGVIVFEPPLVRDADVATYLCAQVPNRLQRMSLMDIVYHTPDGPFAPSTDDGLLEDDLPGDLRSFVLLTLRYRCKFFTASPDTVIARLAALRIRWVDDLHLQVGGHSLPLASFPHMAVLVRSPEVTTILAPHSARSDGRALMVIAEALGEAIGSRQMTSGQLYAVAARLHQAGHGATAEGLAAALELLPGDVAAAMKDSRSVIATLLHVIRPFAELWDQQAVLDTVLRREGAVTERDLAEAFQDGASLVEACRSGSVETAALQLGVELGALNTVLKALGDPYRIIDRSAHHQEAFTRYYLRQEARVRESLRATFRPSFISGELSAYVAARITPAPTAPPEAGQVLFKSYPADWDAWLMTWLDSLGVTTLSDVPPHKTSLEAVREANQRTLKVLAPRARLLVLVKAGAEAEVAVPWRDPEGLEGRLLALGAAQGWMDFDPLDDAACLIWLQRAGLWPADWPVSLIPAEQGLAEGDINAFRDAERKARQARINPPRVLSYSGGSYISGETDLASLADHIADLTRANGALLASSSKPLKRAGVVQTRRGGGGGGGGHPPSINRMTDEEKGVVGFFGEAIAFEWLKRKYGRTRVVDHGCWKSSYRRHVCGEPGDDGLGYDFEISSGKATWFFEVKATSAADPGDRRMIEMGSTEIMKAEACRAENRQHYRILHVVNALNPERASLSVLPNPRTENGKAFFTEQETAGVRLHFFGVGRPARSS
ncbi:hypothetical protein HMPREF0185_00450 [Brevundimonas diminuta 470-4]|nr:hypothetical protein HMPREF0185_00450 [Brevundimonas diminuta 470-4]